MLPIPLCGADHAVKIRKPRRETSKLGSNLDFGLAGVKRQGFPVEFKLTPKPAERPSASDRP